MLRTRSTFTLYLTREHDPNVSTYAAEQANTQMIRDALRTTFPDLGEEGCPVQVNHYHTEFMSNVFRVTVKMRAKGPSARRVERHAISAIQHLGWCDNDASYGNRQVESVTLIGPAPHGDQVSDSTTPTPPDETLDEEDAQFDEDDEDVDEDDEDVDEDDDDMESAAD